MERIFIEKTPDYEGENVKIWNWNSHSYQINAGRRQGLCCAFAFVFRTVLCFAAIAPKEI